MKNNIITILVFILLLVLTRYTFLNYLDSLFFDFLRRIVTAIWLIVSVYGVYNFTEKL